MPSVPSVTILATVFLILFMPTLHAQSEIIDRVLAVVGGEVITQSDVDGALALGLGQVGGAAFGAVRAEPGAPNAAAAPGGTPVAKATGAQGSLDRRGAALDRLIERTLMLTEVRRYVPPEPDTAAIEQRLQAIRERFPSATAWAQALATSGMDEARLREFMRNDLRIQAYLNERFASPEPERRNAMIADWLAGLRRRAEVTRLYPPPP